MFYLIEKTNGTKVSVNLPALNELIEAGEVSRLLEEESGCHSTFVLVGYHDEKPFISGLFSDSDKAEQFALSE